ncbi:MAG TPA: hypothetical protein VGE67_16645 [Haloferula sp.]
MKPAPADPYQKPDDPGSPPDPPPTKEGAYLPLVGAMIFFVLGGLSSPTPFFSAMSLALAAMGISTASNKLQRYLGIIIFAFSATALLLGAIEAG